MRSRGLVVAIAVVLAVLAAVGVIVYTNQVRTQVETENTVAVIVSNQDIPANTNLDPLIAQGAFEFVRVPDNALVADAVTTEEQLTGKTTSAPIFAREQIPESRIGGESALSFVGVSEGHLGLTMSLSTARGGGGIVQRGDSVAVFATFEEGTPVTKQALRSLLSPQQIQQFFTQLISAGQATNLGQSDVFLMPFKFTVVLVPAADVLAIQNPTVDEQGRTAENAQIQMTLDALPEDARLLVFGNETATIWVGLLPPSDAEEGYPIEGQIGIDFDRLVGVVRQ